MKFLASLSFVLAVTALVFLFQKQKEIESVSVQLIIVQDQVNTLQVENEQLQREAKIMNTTIVLCQEQLMECKYGSE